MKLNGAGEGKRVCKASRAPRHRAYSKGWLRPARLAQRRFGAQAKSGCRLRCKVRGRPEQANAAITLHPLR